MKFGSLPVGDAEGCVLAHTLRVGEEVLKKGRVLGPADLGKLRAAGHVEVVCARLEPGDVAEDAAAARVAAVVAGAGVTVAAPATGRANLFAATRGLVAIDRQGVDRLNRVDESVTLATVAPHRVVDAGEMVGTVKIIPFAVADEVLARCATGPLVSVVPFRPVRVGLVLTQLPGANQRLLDRAGASQRTRVERLGGTLARELRVPHRTDAIAAAIDQLVDYDLVLILGASAIVDRHDVVPAAVVRAGGAIDHLGMPVDPGNLLLLAHRGQTTIVGVPGCARSLKPSGFDWVLERLVAGVEVTRADLMSMGVGGLLVEAPSRPQPRVGPEAPPHVPVVGAVVLAAGRSQRMGENKLLLPLDGVPIVARVVGEVLGAGVRPVVVVTGHEAESVRAALAGQPVGFAHNPDYTSGLAGSLRVGLAALGDVDGALICLGDMPLVTRGHIGALLRAFDPDGDHTIYIPTWERKRGNPILWARHHFAEMSAIAGDVGAKGLLDQHAGAVKLVPVDDAGVTVDVDTPQAFDELRRR